MTIVAQDPGVRSDSGSILTAEVNVPAEHLDRGPWGYRVHVVDYDASTHRSYAPLILADEADGFPNPSNTTILDDPQFHQQNVYAIVMRILSRFEHALGRRVPWGFSSHQLKVAPHAFAEANAYYSRYDNGLLLGYFESKKARKSIFTCLSHDVVAHETTHAILDGIRSRYLEPTSLDQAAFHEGFSDVVALLSVFALKPVVKHLLQQSFGHDNRVSRALLSEKSLRNSALLGLAEQMGQELKHARGGKREGALRQSAKLPLKRSYYHDDPEFRAPHRRGEILVLGIMHSFIKVWRRRLTGLAPRRVNSLDIDRVVEEAAEAADYLLTMVIRALDYSPPVHITFPDFLSAMLTADSEMRPDDSRYEYRSTLRSVFSRLGINKPRHAANDGTWKGPEREINYDRVHFEALKSSPEEMFRFVWENREELGIYSEGFSRVISIQPSLRVDQDGFFLQETVAEVMQYLEVTAKDLPSHGLKAPPGLDAGEPVYLQSGSTLIFDEFGRLKYSIGTSLDNWSAQQSRLDHMARTGHFRKGSYDRLQRLHRMKAGASSDTQTEGW